MKKKIFLASVTTIALLAAAPPAFADQNAIGAGFSNSVPGSVGPSISGFIYGNTSNPSGNGNGVLPSESPGPWAHGNPGDGPTENGGSMGTFLAPVASGGTASPDFANGKDPGPDFVK